METTIRTLAVLILIVICILAASIIDAGHSSFMETAAFGQVRGNSGGTQDSLTDRDKKRMSAMGLLAHLAATGQLGGSMATKIAATIATTGDVTTGALVAGGHAQPSIAVDSTGQHIVIGFNDASGFNLNPISVSGFEYSDDGGQTFTDGGPLPITTPSSSIGPTTYPQVFGDPDVKYLGGSNFIYFSIIVVNGGSSGPAQTLGFHRSTDFGHSWTGPFEIPPATNPNGLLNGLSVDMADKPFADVDPDTGRVLVSWSNFTPFAIGGVEISATFSDNIQDANPVWSTRSIVAATAVDGQSSIPRFAGNGSPNVYLAWQRFSANPADNNDDIGFAMSADNGATWNNPINAAPAAFFTMDQVLGDDRVSSAPGLAVDNSSGGGKGNIYVVYSNNNLKDGADIVFQRSTDGGLSFTSPILINSRPGNDRAQWFPWVTVDNSSGRVYVFYYDQGIDTSGDLTQTTYQFSDDGGLTWQHPMPLTDRPFKAGWGKDLGHPNLGDYNQAVAQKGELFAAWAGTGLFPFTSGLPTVHMQTPKVVFTRVPASSAQVSLTSNFSGTTLTDGDGNGFIDAGEQVRFKFPLTNYVTNPSLNPTVVTGIIATLSAATSTVTIVQGTSSYPSIPPGASATNDTDFIVQLAPSYVRGTPLGLVLNITSNQGSATLLVTRATGTPLATAIFQENFGSTTPGTLPAGWLTQHMGGNNTVPWTTSNMFNAGNTGAFHINANDGAARDATRWERLLSPLIQVPANSEYVTLDFDVSYNTQDDPAFNILAYDGFLLRIGDYGPSNSPPAFLRAVLAEAFEEEFTTGSLEHFPKHFPRSTSTAYLEDLSAWAGDSAGLQHIHMKLNGMAGRSIRLWWEYTQDASLTCKDVRPAAPACGVLFDNLVVQSVVTVQADLSVTKSTTSGPAISGNNITYRIDATNNGPTLDTSSTVTDNLPSLLSFVSCSATGGGTCSGSDNNQTVTLPAGPGPQTITLTAAISCSAAGGTPLSNTATITSALPDPDHSNNFSSISTTIANPPPVMSCPADIVTTAQPGQTSAITSFTVGATDNCPLSAAVAANPASGSSFFVGMTNVTATVTDSGGAQSSCGFNVTVNAPTTTQVKSIGGQYGGSVILTATVSPTPLAGQTATGTVNFFANGNLVGSSSIDASGVAVLPYTIIQAPGTYSINANYVSTSPFFLASAGSGQLTVAKADQTITVAALSSHVYGDVPFSINATSSSGLAVSFNAAGNCSLSVNLVTITAAGTCTLTASQQGDVNYNPAQPVNQTFTINRATASVTLNAGGKTYGSSDPVLTGTLSGFLPSDNLTAIFARTAGEAAGTYTISATLGPANVLGNYNITYNIASFVIAPLAASVTPMPASKTFGDADPAALTTGTLTGFLVGDNVTAAYSRDPGDAPGRYTINAVLSPASALGNYVITYNTAAFTINKYSFSTCDANRHCTGGSKPNDNGIGGRLTITSTAAFGGSATAVVTLSPATVNAKDALTSPGTDNNNQPLPPVFKLWLAPAGDPAHPVLFGTGTAVKTGPDQNGNYAWSGTVTGMLDESSIMPGNYIAHVFGDDGASLTNNQVPNDAGYARADTNDFIYPTLSATLTVTDASTTVSITAPAVIYKNDAAVTITVTSPAGTPGGSVSLIVDGGTPLTAPLSNGSTDFSIPGLNAGDHRVSASYVTQGDFAGSSAAANLHVNPRSITVTADAKSKTYGDSDPALTYQITAGSLVRGDSFAGSLTRAAGENVGIYVIQQATLALSSNYTLTFTGANLTITPAPLTVASNPQTKVYGAKDPALTFQASGFKRSDTAGTALAGTLARAPGENVRQYPITQGTLTAINYALRFTGNTFTITAAPLTMTVNSVSRYLGVGNPSLIVRFIGLVNSDNISATGNTTATPTSPPGKYPITIPRSNIVDPSGRLSNYAITNTALPAGYATNGTVGVILTYSAYVTKIDCSGLAFSGQSYSDSFDSLKGPHAISHVNLRGDVAVNGNAELDNEAVIYGSVYTPLPTVRNCEQHGVDGIVNGVTLSGDAMATGSPAYAGNPAVPPYLALTPVPFITSPVAPFKAGLTDLVVTSNQTLHPDGASPQYRNITVNANVTLTLLAGTYTISTLKARGGASIVAAGPVILNIAGPNNPDSDPENATAVLELLDVTIMSGTSGNPNAADIAIVYWGVGKIFVRGQSHAYGVLYAPNAAMKLRDQAGWYGAMVVNDLDVREQTAIHYDLNLGR